MSRDFSKGKIYKITNDYNDDVYVGSTCDTLGKRYSKHKTDSKKEKYKHYKLYQLMNEIGFERFRIQLIIDYPCEDIYQLTQKEGEYIRKMGTLNKIISGRTLKEWYENNKNKIKEYRETNKDKIKENHKEYYETNNDKIKEYNKEYYETNKDKIKEYYETNKDKIKEYREINKDKRNKIHKEYYEVNKDKKNKKINCVCGCEVGKNNLLRHQNSPKHIKLMEQLNNTSSNEVVV